MGYDVTFHPISRAFVSRYVLDVFDDPSLARGRAKELATGSEQAAEIEELYREGANDLREFLRRARAPKNDGIEGSPVLWTTAALARYAYPYWSARGSRLSLINDEELWALRSPLAEGSLGKLSYQAAHQSATGITFNWTAADPIWNIAALERWLASHEHEAAAVFDEHGFHALRGAISYARKHSLGLLEATDIDTTVGRERDAAPFEIRQDPVTPQGFGEAVTRVLSSISLKEASCGEPTPDVLNCKSSVGVCARCWGGSVGDAVGQTAADLLGGAVLTAPGLAELLGQPRPRDRAMIVELDGVTSAEGDLLWHVPELDGVARHDLGKCYAAVPPRRFTVKPGARLSAGQPLTDGPIAMQQLISIMGPRVVATHLHRELATRNCVVEPRTIALYVRAIHSALITDACDSRFEDLDLVSWAAFQEEDSRVNASGGRAPSAVSWLAALR